MKQYDSTDIEKKWQKYWAENKTYKTENSVEGKENFYALSEFAYPSGNLHVGHWYAFAVPDIYARFKRMNGYNVLYPMGFDAFGLPAENAAIKRGLDPRKWTYENMEYMKVQLRSMGASFDWDRLIATCDPEYYKWTQWMFTEFYKNDLIERSTAKTNWCESCKTVLANEQVVGGKCERCGNDVIQRDMAQWMLKITEFADDLIDDLDTLNWDESIKQAQREWIGRKEGSEISFEVKDLDSKIEVFTTRADTLFGATYVVLAPEHELIQNLKGQIKNWSEVENYLDIVSKKSDLERQQSKEKTGIELKGITTINPATNEEIPIWIADYVLGHFGTGAVMAVPAHDERDCEFALKYDLPFKFVILPTAGETGNSRPLVTTGENTFILSAGTTGEAGQKQINAEWNAMYDLLSEVHDNNGLLPVGKRFCCTFEGKLINSQVNEKTEIITVPGFNPIQKGKLFKNTQRVYGIIKEKNTDNFLILKHANGDLGLLTGGVELGEKSSETAVREVFEETGYTASVIKKEDYRVFTEYYSKNKHKNISSLGEVFVLEIEDIKNVSKVAKEELNKHKPIWIKKEDILNSINLDAHLDILNRYLNPPKNKDTDLISFNAITSKEVIPKITEYVAGIMKKTYRLRDWGISRQRYWGTPIPVVYDPEGNAHSIPVEHLPWILPSDVDHTPDGTAPLARSQELQKRTEDIFGVGWTPEIDTMDTFVDSSWYFYRYLDNKNDSEFASAEAMKNWMPVDMYFGGAEHTTMHLLYSRFWVKALHKIGLVDHNEPYKGRLNRGLILGPNGVKMSKSKGNAINPDEVVSHVGADAVRMYLAFIGPFNEPGNYPWDPNGVVGMRRFIERVWRLSEKITDDESPLHLVKALHKTIKKVEDDIGRLKLNTAISSMMVLVNTAEKTSSISKGDYESLLKMLGAFAPHVAEEIWQDILGNSESIHLEDWPKHNDSLIVDDMVTLGVQVNGKVRTEISISPDTQSDEVQKIVLELEEVKKWIDGKEVKKFIYVPRRIINIVI